MRLTAIAAAVGGAVALVGFANAANASATIDLIWADTGTNQLGSVSSSAVFTLRVILTAGPNGSQGAAVSVDYSEAVDTLSVVGFMSTPSGPLPIDLHANTDTGTRITSLDSGSIPPYVGAGLMAGQSHQLGTVTFHKNQIADGLWEIRSDANSPLDQVLDLAGNDITATTTFNSAFLGEADPCRCDFAIDINALRGGSPTVAVGSTKDITAKARIAKGSALPDTKVDAALRIDAIDGTAIIDSQSSSPIQLEVGKGGNGDKLTLNINQCNSGFIYFDATFSVPVPSCSNNPCTATRSIRKTCQ